MSRIFFAASDELRVTIRVGFVVEVFPSPFAFVERSDLKLALARLGDFAHVAFEFDRALGAHRNDVVVDYLLCRFHGAVMVAVWWQ